MKSVFSIIFSIFFASAVSDYVLQQINGIDGVAQAIEFDSDGNAYVSTISNEDGSPHLYKLNSAKEILWTTNITDFVSKIIINSQNDIYFQSPAGPLETSISIFREDTLTIEKIDEIYGFAIFLDEANNIIYTGNDGIKILRPKSTTPILIKNLEGYYIPDEFSFGIDSKGNVYLGLTDFTLYKFSFAVLTNESKQDDNPFATNYNLDANYFIDCLTLDQNDDVWVFTSNFFSTSQILKFSNGVFSEILIDDKYETHTSKAVRDRVYVISVTFNDVIAPTYFLTLDGEVHNIQELNEVPADTYLTAQIVADNDGNAYIGAYFASERGPLVLIRPNEDNAVWISFPQIVNIDTMIVDGNDSLWIVTDGQGVYCVSKGETAAVKVVASEEVDEDLYGDVNINKRTNELLVLGFSGLYVVSNEFV